MTIYVRVESLNGRYKFLELADKLQKHGFEDRVEYNEGGWLVKSVYTVQPHLKFENEDDAVAYVLTFGGEVSKELPLRKD